MVILSTAQYVTALWININQDSGNATPTQLVSMFMHFSSTVFYVLLYRQWSWLGSCCSFSCHCSPKKVEGRFNNKTIVILQCRTSWILVWRNHHYEGKLYSVKHFPLSDDKEYGLWGSWDQGAESWYTLCYRDHAIRRLWSTGKTIHQALPY